jgi:CRP-like cAMP-binding protein
MGAYNMNATAFTQQIEAMSDCCTTRVTITRLLTQLQQQKKLSVDSQHHLILKGWDTQ